MLARLNEFCVSAARPLVIFYVVGIFVFCGLYVSGVNYVTSETSFIPFPGWTTLFLIGFTVLGSSQVATRIKLGRTELPFKEFLRHVGFKDVLLQVFVFGLFFIHPTISLSLPAMHTAILGKAGSQTFIVKKTGVKAGVDVCSPAVTVRSDGWFSGGKVCDLSDELASRLRKGDAIILYGRSSRAGIFYKSVRPASVYDLEQRP